MQLYQYQHQNTPVPSIGNVCTALWCRNMDPLGCRHETLEAFHMRYQRQILDIRWWAYVSNAEVQWIFSDIQLTAVSEAGSRQTRIFCCAPEKVLFYTGMFSSSSWRLMHYIKRHLQRFIIFPVSAISILHSSIVKVPVSGCHVICADWTCDCICRCI